MLTFYAFNPLLPMEPKSVFDDSGEDAHTHTGKMIGFIRRHFFCRRATGRAPSRELEQTGSDGDTDAEWEIFRAIASKTDLSDGGQKGNTLHLMYVYGGSASADGKLIERPAAETAGAASRPVSVFFINS